MKVRGVLLFLFLFLLSLITSIQGGKTLTKKEYDDFIQSLIDLIEKWRASSSIHDDWWQRSSPIADEPAQQLALIENRVQSMEAQLQSLKGNFDGPLPTGEDRESSSIYTEHLEPYYPNAVARLQQTDSSLRNLEVQINGVGRKLGFTTNDEQRIDHYLQQAKKRGNQELATYMETWEGKGVVGEIPESAKQSILERLKKVVRSHGFTAELLAKLYIDYYDIKTQLHFAKMGLNLVPDRLEKTQALVLGSKSQVYRDFIQSLLEQNGQASPLKDADSEAVLHGNWQRANHADLQNLGSKYDQILLDVEQGRDIGQSSNSASNDLSDNFRRFHL